MGGAVDFPNNNAFAYTKDASLPIVAKAHLTTVPAQYTGHFSVAIGDANSGVNWTTLAVSYYNVATPTTIVTIPINQVDKVDANDVLYVDLSQVSLSNGVEYILKVSVEDNAGNKNEFTERLIK